MNTPAHSPSGLLNLNKPVRVTSRAVVDWVVEAVGRRLPVGHAGTLDPLASGVLVVCVGAATRLVEYVQRMTKTYRAVVRLGARSDTDDAEGTIVAVRDAPIPSEARVREALVSLVGTIRQVPPRFSAIHVDGRRAYELARRGRSVPIAPREVRIDQITLMRYTWPRLELDIVCGAGTYIRSIARDLGEALGCGGLLEALVRTRVGPFRIEDALDAREVTRVSLIDHLIEPLQAVAELPKLRIDELQQELIRHGRPLDAARMTGAPSPLPEGEIALVGPSGALVAIAEPEPIAGLLSPRRVLIGR
jgi:tRNA pseudouridine55 synthase